MFIQNKRKLDKNKFKKKIFKKIQTYMQKFISLRDSCFERQNFSFSSGFNKITTSTLQATSNKYKITIYARKKKVNKSNKRIGKEKYLLLIRLTQLDYITLAIKNNKNKIVN